MKTIKNKKRKLIERIITRQMMYQATKRITTIVSILALVLFTACSKDDDSQGPIDPIENFNLDNLKGEWIRVASNNPTADGMIIEMANTSGKLIDKAGSSFGVGDIKWKSIKAVDGENYTHEELGSDSNYYSSTMVLRTDDTLRISVGSSGAGNIQKWVRVGQYTPANSLKNLLGGWIRVASNNPVADGLIIEMSGTSGELKDKAGSSFSVGDIKWKNITAVGSENYAYEELGSDSNYYAASMVLKADDTLRIKVGSTGAGNEQKWVREGEYVPTTASAETLPCSINQALTLKNGPGEIDYIVDCVVDITAALTIEPGVVIQFKENSGFGVYDSGTLNAVGTDVEPIIFKGITQTQGLWRGVHIETRSVDNQLEYLQIEDAGSAYVYCCNNVASLLLKGAKISLKNVSIKNGAGIGLMAINDTEFDAYDAIRVENHKEYAVWVAPNIVTALDGVTSDYSGNDKDFIFVQDGNIDLTSTWKKQNVPYLLEGKVMDVTEALTIEAGVEIVVQENGGIGVYDEGSLYVNGVDSEPVIIRGNEAIKGYWRGIHIETNSSSNTLNYLQLSDAGSNYVYCCNEVGSLYLKGGKASIKNSTISNGKSYGIVAKNNFDLSGFNGNTITTHTLAPMYISVENINELDGMNSSYIDNDEDYLLVYDSQVTKGTTVRPANVPYQIENGVVIDIIDRLNINAGAEIVFEENAGLGVYDAGVLYATGTSSEKIIFRGKENINGYWRGIHTETNSANNVIIYAEINNAGSNYVYCCNDAAALFVKDGLMKVENTIISESGGCGLLVKPSANLTELDITFFNNTNGDVCN